MGNVGMVSTREMTEPAKTSESGDINPPRRESLRELVRRQRRSLGRHRGIQYWLRVRGYYILAAFAGLFVLNAVVVGGRVAYDVSLQIDSPWDTGNPRDTGEIRVVGRSTDSGTRETLERYVLSSNPGSPVRQANATSDSCRQLLPGISPRQTIVCEQSSTGDLIDRVANLDDAIGYADVSDVDQTTGVKKISLDGRGATLRDIRDHDYPFWTVE